MQKFDILIIGAGASGLTAATELSKKGLKVGVLEARNRIGGRVHTITNEKFTEPVETGAEFVHGHLPLTLSLLKQYDITALPVEGEMWRTKNGQLTPDSDYVTGFEELDKRLANLKNDMSVESFLLTHFPGEKYQQLRTSMRRFVEGFDTADPLRASAFKLREEWGGFEEEEQQYRVEGGYIKLLEALEGEYKGNGGELFLSEQIKIVQWSKSNVVVTTASQKSYSASKVIVTVPVSIIQQPDQSKTAIQFVPGIPEQKMMFRQLGFGSVIKIIIEFREPFWMTKRFEERTGLNLKTMGFLFTEGVVPTWWTQYPAKSAILTGWIGGPATKALSDTSEQTLFETAISTLAKTFGEKEAEFIKQVVHWKVIKWNNEPFTKGSYTYTTVNDDKAINQLKQPIEDVLFFAGEALYIGPSNGTVEAAITSGYDAAKAVLETLGKDITL